MPWKAENLCGVHFGKFICIERVLPKRPSRYLCRCDCGKECVIFTANLKRGLSKQCIDCCATSKSSALIGKKFEKLLVLGIEKVNGQAKAKVLCDCGNIKYLNPYVVRTKSKSCGKCSLGILDVGYKKGLLEIIEKIDKSTSLAQCECGNIKKVKDYHLQTQMPSCGCYIKNKNIEKAKKLVGLKIGRLKVKKFIGMFGPEKKTRAKYLLQCKCGKTVETMISYLYGSLSCGCLQKENVAKGSKNSHAKLNETEVLSIRELFKSGLYSQTELSKIFKTTLTNISLILNNKSWKHI